MSVHTNFVWSLPTRECGLKSYANGTLAGILSSLPTRECGLKSVALSEIAIPVQVTPYAGVWIEIGNSLDSGIITTSLPTRECGLKSHATIGKPTVVSHSLRGSVD